MLDKIFAAIRLEPVALVGLAIIGLQAAQDALSGGADLNTVLVAFGQAILVALARQLVTPTAKA
jgi:hypothetical protein